MTSKLLMIKTPNIFLSISLFLVVSSIALGQEFSDDPFGQESSNFNDSSDSSSDSSDSGDSGDSGDTSGYSSNSASNSASGTSSNASSADFSSNSSNASSNQSSSSNASGSASSSNSASNAGFSDSNESSNASFGTSSADYDSEVIDSADPTSSLNDPLTQTSDIAIEGLEESGQGFDESIITEDLESSVPLVEQETSIIDTTEQMAEPPAKAYVPVPEPNDFAGTPPIPGTMRSLADSEAPDEYVIEKGDTLFDIGDQLLNEPGYWPKIWALNPYIKNPHFIYPGMRIRFYSGDDENPPFLQFVAEQEVPVEPDYPFIMLSEAFPELAAEHVSPSDVISSADLEIPFDVSEWLIMSGNLFSTNQRTLNVAGYVFNETKSALGTIYSGESGEALALQDIEVVIQSDKTLALGTTYSILRYDGPKMREDKEKPPVHLYYHIGRMKIFEKLPSGFGYLGRTDELLLGPKKGDILTPYISSVRTISSTETTPAQSKTGNILAFEIPNKTMGKEGDIVFIDLPNAGVGSMYQIFQQRGLLDHYLHSEQLYGSLKPIARVKIIDSQNGGSTGLVTYSTQEIKIGDYLRAKL